MKSTWFKISLMFAVILMTCTGCFRKPFHAPVYSEIGTNETAFVIPLEGETGKQDSFASSDLLLERKVATKRIEIPHRWEETGRKPLGIFVAPGKYLPTVTVIKVDRTPVTQTWTASANTGTSKGNQALYAESKDSIFVSSGFTLTAWVPEESAHIFLYRYKGKSLADIINSQIFNSVQSIYTRMTAEYDLADLRSKKQEITDAVREEVIPFYKEWGIEISQDMGLVGGLVYGDDKIQEAINKVFISQTLEAEAEARVKAQAKENERDMLEAKKDAEIVMVKVKAEADAIREKAQAIKDAGDMYLQIEKIKVLQQMATALEKWDGRMPHYLGAQLPTMLVSENSEPEPAPPAQ